MGKNRKIVRRILYKVLPLKSYFSVLSKFYFISFKMGLLKGNKSYDYPYFLNNVIRKGDVCIDIGANLGYLSTLFSSLVGKTGKVYSVEPVKPVLEVLRKNTARLSNVEILPYALGEENKTIQLGNNTVGKNGFMASGSHSIMSAGPDVDVTFDAEMKKGSELFGDLEKLDFVKCDVEGYEVIVLKELAPVILKHRPMMLIEARDENRKELLEYFAANDFTSYILQQDQLTLATNEDFIDMLTVPNERLSEVDQFIS